MVFDPEDVRAYMVRKGMRDADDRSPVTPPEERFYAAYKPRDDARDAQEVERKRQSDEMWERAKAAQERYWRMKEHMRKAREWGRENGFFVGTRGRIPARVWAGYQEAIGEEL
ncbi:hypothetical protein ABZ464_02820 [Streptomyces sp. NPDC005820]|uniref:Lsr2 family DNA-binding protein n=1 Tax=Streptomyces sp. NPDC005820 TaxID=3157069 RepID=UPI0033E18266